MYLANNADEEVNSFSALEWTLDFVPGINCSIKFYFTAPLNSSLFTNLTQFGRLLYCLRAM